ncbi:MAG: hypothetical protein ACK55Z_36385, partial [bacterium]
VSYFPRNRKNFDGFKGGVGRDEMGRGGMGKGGIGNFFNGGRAPFAICQTIGLKRVADIDEHAHDHPPSR